MNNLFPFHLYPMPFILIRYASFLTYKKCKFKNIRLLSNLIVKQIEIKGLLHVFDQIYPVKAYCPCTARCEAGSLEVLSTDAPKPITCPVPEVGRMRRIMLSYELPGYGTPAWTNGLNAWKS